jgi:hypothetical protein
MLKVIYYKQYVWLQYVSCVQYAYNSNGSSFIILKLKANENIFTAALMVFYVLQKKYQK